VHVADIVNDEAAALDAVLSSWARNYDLYTQSSAFIAYHQFLAFLRFLMHVSIRWRLKQRRIWNH